MVVFLYKGYSKLFREVLQAAQPSLDIRLSHIVDSVVVITQRGSIYSVEDHDDVATTTTAATESSVNHDNDDEEDDDDDDNSSNASVVVKCTNGQTFTGKLIIKNDD